MILKYFLSRWVSSLVIFASMDFVWLTLTFSKFYKPLLGHLFTENVQYVPAIMFYLIYSFGITAIVLLPSTMANKSVSWVFFQGFLLGLVAYSTYDLTNHASLKNWPAIITLVDILWGSLLTASISTICYRLPF